MSGSSARRTSVPSPSCAGTLQGRGAETLRRRASPHRSQELAARAATCHGRRLSAVEFPMCCRRGERPPRRRPRPTPASPLEVEGRSRPELAVERTRGWVIPLVQRRATGDVLSGLGHRRRDRPGDASRPSPRLVTYPVPNAGLTGDPASFSRPSSSSAQASDLTLTRGIEHRGDAVGRRSTQSTRPIKLTALVAEFNALRFVLAELGVGPGLPGQCTERVASEPNYPDGDRVLPGRPQVLRSVARDDGGPIAAHLNLREPQWPRSVDGLSRSDC